MPPCDKETAYTPGPWEVRRSIKNNDCAIMAPGVAFGSTKIYPSLLIAECYADIRITRENNAAEAWANARVMSAAPDLLNVLKEIVYYRGGADSALQDEYIMARAAAAIVKAEQS